MHHARLLSFFRTRLFFIYASQMCPLAHFPTLLTHYSPRPRNSPRSALENNRKCKPFYYRFLNCAHFGILKTMTALKRPQSNNCMQIFRRMFENVRAMQK